MNDCLLEMNWSTVDEGVYSMKFSPIDINPYIIRSVNED